MEFDNVFTRSLKSDEFICNSGSPFLDEYNYDGSDTLVKTGKTNIYDMIQAAAPAQDINNVVARFLNGDSDALSSVDSFYGDFSDMPTTYAELFDRVRTCKDLFGSLPIELRNEFDNNPYEFWSRFGTRGFDDIISRYTPDISMGTMENASTIESEVKE